MGGLYRVPGEYYPATARGRPRYSEAGPGSPAGAGVGGIWGWARVLGCSAAGRPQVPPLRGPVGPGPPCTWDLGNAASGPIRARFHLILSKASQNARVSPKYVQKACLSPCFQKRVQKSPLGILRISFLRAFSHKELMGHFKPAAEFIVKMTKCRQYVRTG